MAVLRSPAPHSSRKKLADALRILSEIKTSHKSWMNFSPSTRDRDTPLHPHPVFGVRINKLMSGSPLGATIKKTGWLYFLKHGRAELVCAEVSIVSGRHKNVRFTEGPFVKKLFQSIETVIGDPRIFRRRHELRFLRVESVHLFCLWLRRGRRVEYFIPVTSNSTVLNRGVWISRGQFTKSLRSEGQRVRDAQKRMLPLLERHRG